VEEGRAGSPKMMSIGLHCRLARPGRVAGLAEFIDFAKSYKKEVWICTREGIADFWHENHFPMGAGSPVKPNPTLEDVEKSNIGEIDMVKLDIAAKVDEKKEEEPVTADVI
jgi:hypothetical protein